MTTWDDCLDRHLTSVQRALLKEILEREDLSAAESWPMLTRDVLSPEHPIAVHQCVHRLAFAGWGPASGPAPAWFPDPATIKQSNISALMAQTGTSDYASLHRWSNDRSSGIAQFWSLMVQRLQIQFRAPPKETLNLCDGVEQPRWLEGARFNLVDSCLRAPQESLAIVESYATAIEGRRLRHWTVSDLRRQVGRIANGLLELGVSRGDRIALDMPMRAEAVAIYLAAIAIGCPVVTIADSFSAQEIRVRFEITSPILIFTQDVIGRDHRVLPLYERVCEADAPRAVVLACDQRADGLRQPDGDTPEQRSPLPNLAVSLRDGDLGWQDFLSSRETIECVPLSPDETITILFSSGTTGAPKAIPWDQTTPLKAAVDGHLHQDLHPGDIACWPSNMGWMMGPWLVFATLLNRATMALFDGSPTGGAFTNFVQDARVTMLGLVPSLVSAWRKGACLEHVDWGRIRVFSSTGECSNPDDMFFLMAKAGYKPVIEYCGGTEIGGGYITGTVVQPSAPATFSTPALGIDVVLLDEQDLPTNVGELFVKPPSMGLSRHLLNADHHAVYFAGVPTAPDGSKLRRHGDRMERFPNGYYRAHGRADDSMNLGGIKVSSVQIEEIAMAAVDGVNELAAIAVPPEGGGPDRLVIYAVPLQTEPVNIKAWQAAMQDAICVQLNPLFRIFDVVPIDALPRTASNKIMRRRLRERYRASTPS